MARNWQRRDSNEGSGPSVPGRDAPPLKPSALAAHQDHLGASENPDAWLDAQTSSFRSSEDEAWAPARFRSPQVIPVSRRGKAAASVQPSHSKEKPGFHASTPAPPSGRGTRLRHTLPSRPVHRNVLSCAEPPGTLSKLLRTVPRVPLRPRISQHLLGTSRSHTMSLTHGRTRGLPAGRWARAGASSAGCRRPGPQRGWRRGASGTAE